MILIYPDAQSLQSSMTSESPCCTLSPSSVASDSMAGWTKSTIQNHHRETCHQRLLEATSLAAHARNKTMQARTGKLSCANVCSSLEKRQGPPLNPQHLQTLATNEQMNESVVCIPPLCTRAKAIQPVQPPKENTWDLLLYRQASNFGTRRPQRTSLLHWTARQHCF